MLDNSRVRAVFAAAVDPVARGLLRAKVSPDVVTIVGGIGSAAAALVFFPTGHLFLGVMVMLVFIFSDLLDGTMARMSGRSGPWGAFLDSTLDRVTDAAIMSGLLVYLWKQSDPAWIAALIALVAGFLTSYTRAKAEAAGLRGDVGMIERAERLIISLTAAGLAGLGLHVLLPIGMWALAVLGVVTVLQRVVSVYGQTHGRSAE